MSKPGTTAMEVGDPHYIEDRLGNTLAVVMGHEHVWIEVLAAGDDPKTLGNWRDVATMLPGQVRRLIELLSAGADTLEKQNG